MTSEAFCILPTADEFIDSIKCRIFGFVVDYSSANFKSVSNVSSVSLEFAFLQSKTKGRVRSQVIQRFLVIRRLAQGQLVPTIGRTWGSDFLEDFEAFHLIGTANNQLLDERIPENREKKNA